METQNATLDRSGHYTALLGATKPDGLPMDLFTSGEARWLGATMNGGEEQPRVLLLSVPYALQAADAQTLGGLPPSAFMLAAPPSPASNNALTATTATSGAASSAAAATSVTGSGTLDFLPLWTGTTTIGNSVLFQSGTGSSAKVGINTTTPGATLDVKGAANVQGLLISPATGTATASGGKASQAYDLVASSFNSSTKLAVNQIFQWKAEAVSNNTSTPSGTLNLLFGSGTSSPAETGLKLSNKGLFTFATGQTFPGAGTVTSVGLSAPSSDFKVTGSPVTKSGTLNLNWNVAPTSNDAANAIVKRDASGNFSGGFIAGNLGVFGLSSGPATVAAGIIGSNTSSGSGVFGTSASGFGIYGTSTSGVGIWGSSSGTSGGSDGVHGVTSSAGASGVAGVNNSGGIGVYGTGGVGVFGTGSSYGMQTDSNVQQARTAGGWVKAMVYYSGNNSGRIATCFNSTLSGAAATTPPCGFAQTKNNVGDYTIDFGFEVDDRFFSLTQQGGLGDLGEWLTACTVFTGNCVSGLSQNQVHVFSIGSSGDADSKFYLIVY
jgi:hypothetical protein